MNNSTNNTVDSKTNSSVTVHLLMEQLSIFNRKNNRKKRYLCLLFILSLSSLFSLVASGQYCGTSPENFKQEWMPIPIQTGISSRSNTKVKIPIKLYFVGERESINVDLLAIKTKITQLNEAFEGGDIAFELCGPPVYLKGQRVYNYEEAELLNQNWAKQKMLNVYVVDKIDLGVSFVSGFANFYSYVFLSNYGYSSNTILIHEIGHHLGLYHTHESYFGKELVDGSNCQEAGDFICDTPADPNLLGTACVYTGDKTDPNGALYRPDASNYMSYAPDRCVNSFTKTQLENMNHIANWLYPSSSISCSYDIKQDESYVAPNPISGNNLWVFIKNEFVRTHIDITLSTTLGKVVRTMENYKAEENLRVLLNVEDLERGFYFLTVYYDKNNYKETFKIYKK